MTGSPDGIEIGLNDALLSALIHWRRLSRYTRPEDFIVCQRNGKHLSDKMIWHANRRVLQAITSEYMKPHCQRHTYATHFLASGGDIYSLKNQLNHSSVTVTEMYSHTQKIRLKERANTFQISREGIEDRAKISESGLTVASKGATENEN
jgi:site-specific recombinase XerD